MATFEQHMAETGRQSELDALRKNFGFDAAKAQFNSTGSFGSGGGGGGLNPEAMAESIIEAMMAPFRDSFERAKKFDKDNPFAFDEELARASANERFDPFYEAELGDFVGGIERQRSASVQDERRILDELTADTESFVGNTKRSLDQALESSGEGFAGSGLFFGGERRRREGELKSETGVRTEDFLRGQGFKGESATIAKDRSLKGILAQETRGNRLLEAQRETDVQVDVKQQEKESQARRELERQQFIGFPLAGGSQSFTNMAQFL